MRKYFPRILSLFVAMTIAFTSFSVDVFAAEIDDANVIENINQDVNTDDTASTDDVTEPSEPANSTDSNELSTPEADGDDASTPEVTPAVEEPLDEENVEGEVEEELELVEPEEDLDLLQEADNENSDFVIEGVKLVEYKGEAADVVIPETVEVLDAAVFKGNTSITSVVIPTYLTTIPSGAFEGCSSLSSVEFKSDSTLSVGADAFKGCALTSVKVSEGLQTIPAKFMVNAGFGDNATLYLSSTVRKIDKEAFERVDNSGLTIANIQFAENGNLTNIGRDAFKGNVNLKSLSIPASVEGIEGYAFYGCTGLESVAFPESGKLSTLDEYSFAGCTGITSIVIPSSVKVLGEGVFKDDSKLSNVELKFGNLNSSGIYVFRRCNISNIRLAEGMTKIQRYFSGATFAPGTTLTMPSTVTSVDDYAMADMSGVSTIDFSATGLKTIGGEAIKECPDLETILLPEGLTSIKRYAFSSCSKLKNVILPSTVSELGVGVFYSCKSLEDVIIPNGITEISEALCKECTSLKNIVFSTSVKSIGKQAFTYCTSLEEITIPDTVTSISENAFNRCTGLKEVTLSKNVKTLPYRAFGYCSNLTDMYMGDSVTSIRVPQKGGEDIDAFEGTTGVTFHISSRATTTYNTLKKAGISDGYIARENTITYELNGGSAVGTYKATYDNNAVGEKFRLQNPVKTNHKFAGWYKERNLINPVGIKSGSRYVISVDELSGNAVLYAKWDGPFYNVSFNAADGVITGGTDRAVSFEMANGKTYGAVLGDSFPSATSNSADKRFIGWYTTEGEQITLDTKVVLVGDTTFTARYMDKIQVKKPEMKLVNSEVDYNVANEVSIGDNLYIGCDTEDAVLTYSVSKDGVSVTEGERYTGNLDCFTAAGNYEVTATATLEGKTEVTTARFKAVEDETPVGYSNDTGLWVTIGNPQTRYDASKVSMPYTAAQVKLAGYKVYFGKTLLTEGKDYRVSYRNNVNAAAFDSVNKSGKSNAPTMVATGIGSISGKWEGTFTIRGKAENAVRANAGKFIFELSGDTTYNGTEIKPTIVLKEKESGNVVSTSEYDVTYTNNINAGSGAKVNITFNSNSTKYFGTISKNFTISKYDIRGDSIIVNTKSDNPFNLKNVESLTGVQFKKGDNSLIDLVERKNFTKSTAKKSNKTDDNVIWDATTTIRGTGNFTGVRTFRYKITKQDISAGTNNAKVDYLVAPVYTGRANVYRPVKYQVSDSVSAMRLNSDYKVDFQVKKFGESEFEAADNRTIYPEKSTVKMIVTGKNNYIGSFEYTYTILGGYDLTNTKVENDYFDVTVKDVVWRNSANICKPAITVQNRYTKAKMANNRDYTVKYYFVNDTNVTRKVRGKTTYAIRKAGEEVNKTDKLDIIPAGTEIKAVITGKGTYAGTFERHFNYIIDFSRLSVTIKQQTYTGKKIVPGQSDIVVKNGKDILSNTDYKIVECTNNINAGTATIILQGNGKYKGTRKLNFRIVAKKV